MSVCRWRRPWRDPPLKEKPVPRGPPRRDLPRRKPPFFAYCIAKSPVRGPAPGNFSWGRRKFWGSGWTRFRNRPPGNFPCGRAACLTSAAWRARIEKCRWIDERRKVRRSPGMSKVGNQPRLSHFLPGKSHFLATCRYLSVLPPHKRGVPRPAPARRSAPLRLHLIRRATAGEVLARGGLEGTASPKEAAPPRSFPATHPPPGGRRPGKFSEEGGLEGGRLFQEVPFLQGLPLRN